MNDARWRDVGAPLKGCKKKGRGRCSVQPKPPANLNSGRKKKKETASVTYPFLQMAPATGVPLLSLHWRASQTLLSCGSSAPPSASRVLLPWSLAWIVQQPLLTGLSTQALPPSNPIIPSHGACPQTMGNCSLPTGLKNLAPPAGPTPSP